MKERPQLLLDENIGKPIADALANLLAFHESAPQVLHLLDYIGRHGERDDVWIPKLAREDWLLISTDQGRRGGPKLPRICRQLGVRHVLLVGRLHHAKQFEKARAILVVWPELLAAMDEPRGTRFKLRLRQTTPVLVKA